MLLPNSSEAAYMDLIERVDENENRHPWEISRAENIFRIVEHNAKDCVYADIGSGDMYFARKLSNITSKKVYCVDLNFSEEKVDGQIIQLIDTSKIPDGTVDCLLLMDVLEHVEDDTAFLGNILKMVKDNGQIIITVPAFNILFSEHDKFLKHLRRYNLSQLQKITSEHNLIISGKFYFYSLLFVLRAFLMLLAKITPSKPAIKGIGVWKHGPDHFITTSIVKTLNMDFAVNKFLAKCGVIFFGLSICMVCRKRDEVR
jgi:hypothetical protein